MSIRSKWCEPSKETRKYVLKRDKQCIFCGNKKSLTMVHVFLSRAKGGSGNKENIVTGCYQCHLFILDNPLGKQNNEKSAKMMEYAKKYLIEKECINYGKDFIESLKYKKEIVKLNPIVINTDQFIKRCKTCQYLVKDRYNSNNSIPSYYCKYKKILLNKNTKACEKFMGESD